jgi:chromosome segregation ATPase
MPPETWTPLISAAGLIVVALISYLAGQRTHSEARKAKRDDAQAAALAAHSITAATQSAAETQRGMASDHLVAEWGTRAVADAYAAHIEIRKMGTEIAESRSAVAALSIELAATAHEVAKINADLVAAKAEIVTLNESLGFARIEIVKLLEQAKCRDEIVVDLRRQIADEKDEGEGAVGGTVPDTVVAAP